MRWNSLLLLLVLHSSSGIAEQFVIKTLDLKQQPAADLVVTLTPRNGSQREIPPPDSYQVVQQDLLFKPFISVVPQHAHVTFPNLDETRHHIYSFSEAKPFELKLYGGNQSKAVNFDQVGEVIIGCNIHDWMLAYIYVTDAPIFGKTNENGMFRVDDLIDGHYWLSIHSPRLQQGTVKHALEVKSGHYSQTLELDLMAAETVEAPDFEVEY